MLSAMQAHCYVNQFRVECAKMVSILETKLLPCFDNLKEEADAISKAVIEEVCEIAPNDVELISLSQDRAFDYALEHYDLSTDIRQGLLNLYAVSIYHLFEQRVRELDYRVFKHDLCCYETGVLKKLDEVIGADVLDASARLLLDELRAVANVVKHGDGKSADKLWSINRQLFNAPWEPPSSSVDGDSLPKPDVIDPMFGRQIYVQLNDIYRYRDGITSIWSSYLLGLASIKPDAGCH